MEQSDLLRRANLAYFRSGGNQQPSCMSEVIDIEGEDVYIALVNTNGVLAVYRWIESRDRLKRIYRLPKFILNYLASEFPYTRDNLKKE